MNQETHAKVRLMSCNVSARQFGECIYLLFQLLALSKSLAQTGENKGTPTHPVPEVRHFLA